MMEKTCQFFLWALVVILALLAISGGGVSGQPSDDAAPASSENATKPSDDASADDVTAASDTTTTDVTPSSDTSTDDVTSSSETSADAMPSNETSSDVTPSNDTTEGTPQTPEKADLVVYGSDGKPCLLASLNITLVFKCQGQGCAGEETQDTVSSDNKEDVASYEGSCEEGLSQLTINWSNNRTFTLNLTFLLEGEGESNPGQLDMDVLPPGVSSSARSWSLQRVSLTYDDTAASNGDSASETDTNEKTVSADNLELFRTPLGLSYVCNTPKAVAVVFDDFELAFNSVHLMPFGADTEYFTNDSVQCSGDVSEVDSHAESYTVPLIVAAVLAGIVIIIIVVYAGVRCVTRRVRQSDYKQME